MKEIFYNVYKKGDELYTKSYFSGKTHFGEDVLEREGEEYRKWNPNRSKLAAAIMNGISQIALEPEDIVLYLGAGHGYTPSFVSDIIRAGMVFCVDNSNEVMLDLIPLCEERENMAPLMVDANNPEEYNDLIPEVDVVFQDVAQKNQLEIIVKNMDEFLKKGGFGLLSLKAASVDVAENPKEVFKQVEEEVPENFVIADYRELAPYESHHAFFVLKKKS